MKKNNKKSFSKQFLSAGIYIALAAAVVGVSTNAVVSILSDDVGEIKIPETQNDTKYEVRDIKLPEIPAFPEFESDNLDFPVSGNQKGVSAETNEEKETDEKKSSDENIQQVPDSTSEIDASVEEQSAEAEDLGYPGFVAPCEGFVTREFSPDILVYSPTMYDYRVHLGTDIACELATPIKAISGGTITAVYDDSLLGKSVEIESKDGICIRYCNLSAELPKGIEDGAVIKTGDVVGGVGNTALCETAEASHIHIEATKNGEYFDVTSLYS